MTWWECRECGARRVPVRSGRCAACRLRRAGEQPGERCAVCGHLVELHPAPAARTPMFVTAALLCEQGACGPAVATYAEAWSGGVSVTAEVVDHAATLGLPIGWAVEHLLTSPRAAVAYDHAVAAAVAELGGAKAWLANGPPLVAAAHAALAEALAVEAEERA